MTAMRGTTTILLVEDNPGDIRLIEEAFEATGSQTGELHTVRTGNAALDWLHGRGEFATAPRPELILLDLNLPVTDGHTLLEAIKSDPEWRRIPVIVLTSSQSEDDLTEAYEKYANACLLKPVDPDEFMDTIGAFVDFWLTTATLPPPAE